MAEPEAALYCPPTSDHGAPPHPPPLPGPALTVDSDLDGHPDTAVAATDHGLVLDTDLDGDAIPDVRTVVGPDGASTTGPEPAPGPPAEPAGWDGPGGWEPDWGPDWAAPAPPAPILDPAGGCWVRST